MIHCYNSWILLTHFFCLPILLIPGEETDAFHPTISSSTAKIYGHDGASGRCFTIGKFSLDDYCGILYAFGHHLKMNLSKMSYIAFKMIVLYIMAFGLIMCFQVQDYFEMLRHCMSLVLILMTNIFLVSSFPFCFVGRLCWKVWLCGQNSVERHGLNLSLLDDKRPSIKMWKEG